MLKPNLKKYVENFDWKSVEKEVLFFDKARKKLNIAYNIENLYKERKQGTAIYWQGVDNAREISYDELLKASNKFANFLKKLGIKKGDKCTIFLPRTPELYIAFLGILKIGAIASILFPAFGNEGIAERLAKGDVKLIVTNDELFERVENIKEKKKLKLRYAIIVGKIKVKKIWLEVRSFDEIKKESEYFEIVKTNAKDPALMVFTSATAGTPVAGILLSHYAFIQQLKTAEWVLDLKAGDVYWCTADPGWVTGVVYGIIAPLALGIKMVSFEGRFSADTWFELIEKNKISVMYTAPTALRMLFQDETYKKYNIKSLRHICSVGEWLDPTTFKKVKEAIGLNVHDTYWQTELGAITIANFLCLKIKQGSMGKPVPGIKAFIVDENAKKLGPNQEGILAFDKNTPAIMIGIYKKKKMWRSYFKAGLYLSGDRAYYDKEGYFYFVGRREDMIKTAGERVSVLEMESHLLGHRKVSECAIVGKPDPIRGEVIVAFIVAKKGMSINEDEIKYFMKKQLAGHAYPREVYFVQQLPKTRSGKIMRRVCKAILLGEPLGDISTLANPEVIDHIREVIKSKSEIKK
ncbi:MAG: AMP-binding protein [Candidatus Pacearchaeota archaeon]